MQFFHLDVTSNAPAAPPHRPTAPDMETYRANGVPLQPICLHVGGALGSEVGGLRVGLYEVERSPASSREPVSCQC
jgi:hypothetical protein